MYRPIVASDTRPTDATKYDLDQRLAAVSEVAELRTQRPAGRPLELVGEPGRGGVRAAAGGQVDVVGHDLKRLNRPAVLGALGANQLT